MEAATVLQSSFGLCRPSNSASRSGVLTASGLSSFVKLGFSDGWMKQFPSISHSKVGDRRTASRSRKSTVAVRASSPLESGETAAPIAPLQLESPIGQLLSQILISHPHLVPAAVDQQLEQLQIDRVAENQEAPSASGAELVLYRRIAEVKANERRKALEEILYALVVQKFVDADVSLVPTIIASSSDSCVDTWAPQDGKLQRLHSPEAYEMIQNHLALVLGNRMVESTSVAQIRKFRVGQFYAASVMYGYFLKRVDQRFQLEKAMRSLPNGLNEEGSNIHQALVEETRPKSNGDPFQTPQSHPEVSSSWSGGIRPWGFGHVIKSSRLRSYVMTFDVDTLQAYAMIRSKEAISMIEKHIEALFGRPEIVVTPQGTMDSSNDELIKISFTGLKRLVLEAVTFGSFLWDVESYVDSRYHFVVN